MKKKLLILISAILLVCSMVTAAAAAEARQLLLLDREDMINNRTGQIVVFRMMNDISAKEAVIEEEALQYLRTNKLSLVLEMPRLTVRIPADAFLGAVWDEAVRTREPIRVSLTVDKGDANAVTENFDQWSFSRLGVYRLGNITYDLSVKIRAGIQFEKEITAFAAPLSLKFAYGAVILDGQIKEDKLAVYLLDAGSGKWTSISGTVDKTAKTLTAHISRTGLMILVSDSKQTTGTPSGFNDLAGHWAAQDILQMISRGVVNLSSNGLFYPDQAVTRADYVVWLVRTLSVPQNLTGGQIFSDVDPSQPYYAQIVTAANAGLVSGVGDGKFAPQRTITRQEMAALLARAMAYAHLGGNADLQTLNRFADRERISPWAMESAAVAVDAGLIGGRSNNLFAPLGTATRAEAVVILHRLVGML